MRNSLNGPLAGFGLVLAGAMTGVMALPMGVALAFERPLPESSTAALFDQLVARGGGGGGRGGGGGGGRSGGGGGGGGGRKASGHSGFSNRTYPRLHQARRGLEQKGPNGRGPRRGRRTIPQSHRSSGTPRSGVSPRRLDRQR